MGRLKKLVDAISEESGGVQGRLLIARIGLRAGVNLAKITENTPDNPTLETKLHKAIKQILGKDITID
ncbi:MAG: hypothetical protein AAF518_22225 [Spirochaetota bacterium]